MNENEVINEVIHEGICPHCKKGVLIPESIRGTIGHCPICEEEILFETSNDIRIREQKEKELKLQRETAENFRKQCEENSRREQEKERQEKEFQRTPAVSGGTYSTVFCIYAFVIGGLCFLISCFVSNASEHYFFSNLSYFFFAISFYLRIFEIFNIIIHNQRATILLLKDKQLDSK